MSEMFVEDTLSNWVDGKWTLPIHKLLENLLEIVGDLGQRVCKGVLC